MASPILRSSPSATVFAIALTAVLAQGAVAQAIALYGLNQSGQLTLNATVLDKLKGSTWVDLVVNGSDRYALRNDGRVDMNGVKLYNIQCTDGNGNDVNEGNWVSLAWANGSLWALSSLGYLAKDGVCAAKFDPGDFVFTGLFSGVTAETDNVWSLRSDGACYVNTISGAIFQFEGNEGPGPDAGEGEALDTVWRSGAVKGNGSIFAMRRDGIVVLGTFVGGGGTPFAGTIVAELPFGDTANSATLYSDLIFLDNDTWMALRGNGQAYSQDNTLTALIEFNSNSTSSQIFVDMISLPADMALGTTDMSFLALRNDGKLFRETATSSIGELPKSDYGQIAFSTAEPDLTNANNPGPKVTTYGVQAVEGTAFCVPILATDPATSTDDLIVTVDADTLPAGAVYDDGTRMISWDSPVLGKHKIKVQVSDDVNKPVNKTFKVVVRGPPANPDKNVKPRSAKIKGTQALVGFPLMIPIQASDQNGDKLTMSVDETQPPFTQGAIFDTGTNTIIWDDPQLNDTGSYKIKVDITDGTATVKRKVKFKLISSFLTF